MSKSVQIFILIVFCRFSVLAQPAEKKTSPEQYIANFKEEAIKEMLMYNIPASITLAQGMLESSNGNSDLAMYANNHFGIKCHNTWDGPTFIKDDDKKDECFRKYPSVLDSYTDHSLFLKSGSRYTTLFELKRTDYKAWAKGLKEVGYATDPKYPERLLYLIEKYKLYEYDKIDELPNIKATVISNSGAPKTIQTREILRTHFIKYIVVKPGDSYFSIARDTDKDLWQIYKYNDLKPEDMLVTGQKIYLQPKRRKAIEPFHIVKKGDTMKSISQLHGIRLKSLYKKNKMKPGEEPVIGQQLYMRTTKK
jgi:LysM repeat protein